MVYCGLLDQRSFACGGANPGDRQHERLGCKALDRFRASELSAFGICQAYLHPGASSFPEPPFRRATLGAGFLERPRADVTAVSFDLEGTGSWVGASAASNRCPDDAGCGHSPAVPGSARGRGRYSWYAVPGGRVVYATELAN